MSASDHGPVRRIVATAPPDRPLLAWTVLAGAGSLLAAVTLFGLSGALIAKAAAQPPVLSLGVLIVAVRATGLVRAGARYGERLAGHDLALRALAVLRATLFRRLVPLVPADLRGDPGQLLARFVGDVDRLQDLYLRALLPPAVAAVAALAAVAVAALVVPAAGVVLAAGLLTAGVAVPLAVAALGRRAARRQAAARGALTAELLETSRFGPELASLGLGVQRQARLRDADRRLAGLRRRDAAATALAKALAQGAQAATVVALVAIAAAAVESGQLTAPPAVALVLLGLASFEATMPLADAAQRLAVCRGAAVRIADVLDATPTVTDPPVPRPVPGDGDLVLDHVTFGWPDRPPLLRDASLRLAPGECVALAGPSGAGKSTLAELLVRFRDPLEGRIVFGDADLRDLDQAALRRSVRLVAQDAALFTTTIAENVRLARPDADDAAVAAALAAAGLRSWLATLSAGQDTLVGEDGAQVSGGQRQRIGVARALLAPARFLIVDEPTAHLDVAASGALLGALLGHARKHGIGVLAIVHTTPPGVRFDRTLELRGGRLSPLGSDVQASGALRVTGMLADKIVPEPGAEVISSVPPTRARRSRMPTSPNPASED